MGSQPDPSNLSPTAINSDASQLAGTQQNFNVASQAGSLPNAYGPSGSTNYVQTGTGPGGVPIYTATSQFSPTQQNIYNAFTGAQEGAANSIGNALNFGNYGTESPTQQIGSMTSGTTGQLMNSWLQSQEPFFQTQTQQLDTQLQNEGLGGTDPNAPITATSNQNGTTAIGNPAYNNAMRQLQTNQTNAVAGAASQFEPQAFNQATTLYTEPEQMASALAGISNTPYGTVPAGYGTPVPGLSTSNVVGAASTDEQAAQAQDQLQQSETNAMLSGIGSLGSAGIGAIGNYAGSSAIANALAAI